MTVPEVLDLSGYRAEVSAMARRLNALQQRVTDRDGDALEVAKAAVTELETTIEKLRVSQQDLTAQNDALIEYRRELEEEHDRYRSLFQAAPVAFLVTDERGIITQANRAAVALLNCDERFVLNKPLVTFVVPTHRAAVRQHIVTVSSTGQSGSGEWDVQPRRRPPLPAAVEVAILRQLSGASSLLWLVKDLSSERSLRSRSERLAAELERSDDPGTADHAVTFALDELRGLLLDEQTLDDVLARVAETGRMIVPGASGVSVSLFEQGRPRVAGSSAPWVESLDEYQYTLQEGPCVAAMTDGTWHATDNLDEDTRWPRFAAEASAQGVLSSVSVPLLVRGARLGVLNVYASSRNRFTGKAVSTAQRLGEVASVLVANAQVLAASKRLAHELEQALVSRSTVDMAKGILMTRLGVEPDTAFDALRDLSQRRHMKLRDLAAEIVATPSG